MGKKKHNYNKGTRNDGQLIAVCFTYNMPDGENEIPATLPFKINTTVKGIHRVRYYCYQWERGGNSERLHVQGFVIFHEKLRFKQIKKKIFENERIHIEGKSPNSTNEQARAYCMKIDTRVENTEPVEWGEFPETVRGKRTDLDEALDEVKLGISPEEFRLKHSSVASRCMTYFNQIFSDRDKLLSAASYRTVDNRLYWGPPGSGKTSRVFAEVQKDFGSIAHVYVVSPSASTIWYCGYSGHPVVLLDDFGSDWNGVMPITTLLRFLDRYPFKLEVKGSHTYLATSRIYITSNEPPYMWYPKASGDHMNALLRRLSGNLGRIVKIGDDNDDNYDAFLENM